MKVDGLKENRPWTINENLAVNFKMSIDRVDQLADKHLRFIDFKTGEEDLSAADMDVLFVNGQSDKGGMLQVLSYCEAYLQLREDDVEIEPRIHPLRELSASKGIEELKIAKRPIFSYSEVRDEFRPRLMRFIEEIFDPELKFEQAEKDKGCKFCPFLSLCGRNPKDF